MIVRARRTFLATFFVGLIAAGATFVLAVIPAGSPGTPQERWSGTIDLHQGDKGTIEFTRRGALIEGKIVIDRGGTLIETPIKGEWGGGEILFDRTLSPTSMQPFKGSVQSADPSHVKMEGRFAAGLAGQWTSECTLVSTPEGQGPSTPRRTPPLKSDLVKQARAGLSGLAEAQPGLILDFTKGAAGARWTNAWLTLPFPGDPASDKGFARILENVRLEDGKVYGRVLETHPQWQPRGRVQGWYSKVKIPEAGAEFRSGLGFLEGATGSDGVYFQVRADFPGYTGNEIRRDYLKRYDKSPVADFTQDLSRFKGLEGTLLLVVDAGPKTAGQDWAVWVEPKLLSLASEPAFASFVGGTVGSGRDGARVLNAWGGKSGYLYGNLVLCLVFSHVDANYALRIDSYQGTNFAGSKDLGTVAAGQREVWTTLTRTTPGEWRERVIFNGTYAGDIRYTVSKTGE